jgi:hypothetical protein
VTHPAVLACAVRTTEVAQQTAEIEADSAASDLESLTVLERAREVIAHSRDLLIKLNERGGR